MHADSTWPDLCSCSAFGTAAPSCLWPIHNPPSHRFRGRSVAAIPPTAGLQLICATFVISIVISNVWDRGLRRQGSLTSLHDLRPQLLHHNPDFPLPILYFRVDETSDRCLQKIKTYVVKRKHCPFPFFFDQQRYLFFLNYQTFPYLSTSVNPSFVTDFHSFRLIPES